MSGSSVIGRTSVARQAARGGIHTLGDKAAGVNQHARGDTFIQAVALEVARTLGNRHQLAGHLRADAGD